MMLADQGLDVCSASIRRSEIGMHRVRVDQELRGQHVSGWSTAR